MRIPELTAAIIAAGMLSLSGCAWVGEQVLNKEIGDGAGGAVSDMVRTAGEISDENQQERVDALSSEYDEFLESQDAVSVSDDEQRSVILRKDDEPTNTLPNPR